MQPSNPALRPSLELLRPAPLRCVEGKGTPNSVVEKRLHAHKKNKCNPVFKDQHKTNLQYLIGEDVSKGHDKLS